MIGTLTLAFDIRAVTFSTAKRAMQCTAAGVPT